MALRDTLRTWLGIGDETGPRTKVTDEEILNPLRREETPDSLTAQEIADQLPIVPKQTTNRLKEMEGKRVERRRVGSTDMWSLAEEERDTVVRPAMGSVVEQSTRLKQLGTKVREPGVKIAAAGFVFFLTALTFTISDIGSPSFRELLLSLGYLLGIVGGGIYGASALLRLVGLTGPNLVERFLME